MDSGQNNGADAAANSSASEHKYTRIAAGEGDLEQHSPEESTKEVEEGTLASDVIMAEEEYTIVPQEGEETLDAGHGGGCTDRLSTLRSVFLSRRCAQDVSSLF